MFHYILVLPIVLLVVTAQFRRLGYLVVSLLNLVFLWVGLKSTTDPAHWNWAALQQPGVPEHVAVYLCIGVAFVATGLYCAFGRLRVNTPYRLFALGINLCSLAVIFALIRNSTDDESASIMDDNISTIMATLIFWIPNLLNSYLLALRLPASERPRVLPAASGTQQSAAGDHATR